MPQAQPVPSGLAQVARGLGVDAYTAEILRDFERAGIEGVLLKGPALTRFLYPTDARDYVDADVLIRPDLIEQARRVLAASGFREQALTHQPDLGLPHARLWFRPRDDARVDLHSLIAGVGVAPRELWAALSPLTETVQLAKTDCRVLRPQALLLVAALHAAQHGVEHAKSLEDMRRAIAVGSDDEWRQAAALAEQLDATVNFSSALRFFPEGAVLADRIGLPSAELVEASRGVDSPTRLALGFERLAAEPAWRRRLLRIRREIGPSAEHMRWWSPLARRGTLGLVAAYGVRFLGLVRRTPAGIRAWRRAQRS